MRKRVNAGAAGNGGQNKSRFQIDGWFIRLRFDCQRDLPWRVRSVRELGKQNVHSFIGRALLNGAASYALTGEIDSASSASDCAFACER